MAKVGYILKADHYDGFNDDIKWMEQYGCCRIVQESSDLEKLRPQWKQLMDCLERGDELVISKFSNALRGSRELAFFLEFCRVKVIRVISINDRIDSKGVLFPETTVLDVLNIFGALPEEAAVASLSASELAALAATNLSRVALSVG